LVESVVEVKRISQRATKELREEVGVRESFKKLAKRRLKGLNMWNN